MADARTEAQRLLDAVTAARPDGAPSVSVDVEAVPGDPAQVLLGAAKRADLLVLAHRGPGAFSSALLRSVALQCVQHAPCPVTIVRPSA